MLVVDNYYFNVSASCNVTDIWSISAYERHDTVSLCIVTIIQKFTFIECPLEHLGPINGNGNRLSHDLQRKCPLTTFRKSPKALQATNVLAENPQQ